MEMRNYRKLFLVLSLISITAVNLFYLLLFNKLGDVQRLYLGLLITALIIMYVRVIIKSNPIIMKAGGPNSQDIIINTKKWVEKGLIPPYNGIKHWYPIGYGQNEAAKVLALRSNNITFTLWALNSQLTKVMPLSHQEWRATDKSPIQIDYGIGKTNITYYKKICFFRKTLLRVYITSWTRENIPIFGFNGPLAQKALKVWQQFLTDVEKAGS
jgi:hypothetical protein